MDRATFFEQFDTIAEAPGGIQRLRNLILDMAVRGKLVSQDPSDEPAQDLVVKNKRLILEALEGKSKKLPSLEKSDISIPIGWLRCRLADIALVVMGNSPPGSTYNSDGDGIPLINGPVEFSPEPFGSTVIRQYTTAPTRLCKKGDLLVCVRGATTGRTNIAGFDACIGRGVALVRGWEAQNYLNYLLWRLGAELLQQGKGTTFPSISYNDLAGLEILLPPIAEQKRIVAKVDELMGLCDQFEAEKQHRDSLRQRLRASAFAALMNAPTDDALSTAWSFIHQHWHPLTQHPDDVKDVRRSLLQLAFSGSLTPRLEQTESVEQFAKKISEERQRLLEITTFRDSGNIKGEISESEQLFSIPDEWKWIRIGHAFLISSGTTPSRTKPEYFTNGTESWVKTTDLNNDVVMTCEEKITKAATEDCNLKYYPPGTVCVALYGGAGTIGKSGVLGVETTINQSVCGIYPNQFIDPFYSHWYIKLIRPIWMNFAASLRKAPNINAGIVNNMVFPLAPLAEQKRIVAKVDELMRECDQLEAQLRQQQQVAEQFAASAVSHLVV